MDSSILNIMDEIYENNGRKPMLLSRFGDFLHDKKKIYKIDIPSGTRLSKLVDDSNKYKRAQPYPGAAWWICLKDQEVDHSCISSKVKNSLLFAFLKELPNGLTRYYHKIKPYGFKDCDVELASDYIRMDTADLRPQSLPIEKLSVEEQKKLSAHAIAWAETHGLPNDAIYYIKRDDFSQNSLLSRLINVLSDEDRKRISLPLDIIARLINIK